MEIEKVVISFDPATGKFEFSAPASQMAEASEQAQILIKTVSACLLPKKVSPQESAAPVSPPKVAVSHPANDTPRARKAGGSSDRPGRIGNFEKVDFEISETQERAIYEYYMARKRSEQAEQVAVAIYIGSKVLGRSGFNYNEIYTLLHLGGERTLPKALDEVMRGLVGNNWVAKLDKLYSLKFLATDFVEKLGSEAA